MPDAVPDTTLPISRLGTGSTNGSNNGRGWGFKLEFPYNKYNPQPLPLLEPLAEPVPSLEMGRVVSGTASGVKFLPQHSSFEYRWIN
jgi:hypothetical protein